MKPSPKIPFESCPHNPILTNIHVQTPGVHCIGHGDLVEDANGNWWMVHLGIRLARRYMSHIGRETFLSAVSWNDDGWPVVNGNKCVSLDSCGHDLVQFPVPHEISLDHFDGESLAYCWNYLRNPHRECYRLAQRKSCLTLYGNSFDISDLESPAPPASVKRRTAVGSAPKWISVHKRKTKKPVFSYWQPTSYCFRCY